MLTAVCECTYMYNVHYKEDLGWFSVFMLIGVLFLPTINLASQTSSSAVETLAFDDKFVKPIRDW